MRNLLFFGLLCSPLFAFANPEACGVESRPNVVVIGYWPPTNEMLRPWDARQDDWQGGNWENSGYDIYSFFPEFPPDGDPTNDEHGSPGRTGTGPFPVDYQATSRDFWRLVPPLEPRLLITTSRGGGIAWELEAVEGGHGTATKADPAQDWYNDGFGSETLPQQQTIDPRSWQAIQTYRAGRRLTSTLPLSNIAAKTKSLAVTKIDHGTSGDYLSGFLGLHGIYYQRTHDHTLAAGHIHVGTRVTSDLARRLIQASLRSIIEVYPPPPNPDCDAAGPPAK
ncbi:MAG: hypothetical protein AAF513_12775 [Pseudomonadota bacterium]